MTSRPPPPLALANDPESVGVVVLSRQQEAMEAINRLLRRAGLAAHCLHVADGSNLESTVEVHRPELVVIAAEDRLLPVDAIAALRARQAPAPSVLLLLSECTDAASETALTAGAQDIVSLNNPKRLVLVIQRELVGQRNARALARAAASSADYRRALDSLRAGSTDAIAEVAEGIVIAANAAWLTLIGYSELGSIDGLPVMDCFEPVSHPALKGALSACQHGNWPGEPLRLRARHADGSARPIDVVLALGAAADGESVLTLRVPASRGEDVEDLHAQLEHAIRTDPTTKLLHRAHLLDSLVTHCEQPIAGGVRYLATLQIDHPEQVADRVGPLAAEGLVALLADDVRCHLLPTDLAGRFTGSSLVMVVERGTRADVEHWANQIVTAVRARHYNVAGREVRITVALGLAKIIGADADGAMVRSMEAMRLARTDGGDRSIIRDPAPTGTDADDRTWVQRIKSALMENRFRLQQQPIASLRSGNVESFDLLIRLQDDDGNEILPSEFLAAAQRNDLLRSLDRWVLGACLSLAAERSDPGFFVRISADSIGDATLLPWLKTQIATAAINPSRIIVQVPEADIDLQPEATERLREGLRGLGLRFAIEHYGYGVDPNQLAARLKPEFLKIDGKLMQGIANHPDLQSAVRALVVTAKASGAATIAERVEDANTMAVLFTLGVELIQGRFVQRSEAVTLG